MPTPDDREPPDPPLRRRAPLREFLREEGAGGVALMVAAAVALGWANSPWEAAYTALWETPVTLGLGRFAVQADLRDWVGDGLMTVFFLVVGLEIKRELVHGELRTWRRAALPVVAAAGGMAVPALVYAAVNAGRPGAPGWGVPMATDIAFALGVLALLGRRVPASLRVLLLTLAVVDDLGSVAVVAIFYGGPGVSPALAGVAVGLLVPAGGPGGPARRLEDALHPVSAFVVVPLFALANAGVTLEQGVLAAPGAGAVLGGVVAGRVLGKVAGITAAAWLAVRLGLATRPEGTRWGQLTGVATVAGIGFTVPLFVAGLAFPDGRLLAPVKLGLLAASVVSGVAGALVLVRTGHRLRPDQAG
jgi:Na+:H+ antiporter, NhaA family